MVLPEICVHKLDASTIRVMSVREGGSWNAAAFMINDCQRESVSGSTAQTAAEWGDSSRFFNFAPCPPCINNTHRSLGNLGFRVNIRAAFQFQRSDISAAAAAG